MTQKAIIEKYILDCSKIKNLRSSTRHHKQSEKRSHDFGEKRIGIANTKIGTTS